MHPPTKCRVIVRTKDGKRYLTRWFQMEGVSDDLGPDELTGWQKANRAATHMIARRGLDVAQIDGQYMHPTK